MKREEIISLLNKLITGQFSMQDGGNLIIKYIKERKNVDISSFSVSPFESEMYDLAVRTALEWYEKKFEILKVFKDNKLVTIC
jgi:hypothetical protein